MHRGEARTLPVPEQRSSQMRGDCLSCSKVAICSATSVEKVLTSFTCPLYEAILEPEYRARVMLMWQFGDLAAVKAMLQKPEEKEESR